MDQKIALSNPAAIDEIFAHGDDLAGDQRAHFDVALGDDFAISQQFGLVVGDRRLCGRDQPNPFGWRFGCELGLCRLKISGDGQRPNEHKERKGDFQNLPTARQNISISVISRLLLPTLYGVSEMSMQRSAAVKMLAQRAFLKSIEGEATIALRTLILESPAWLESNTTRSR